MKRLHPSLFLKGQHFSVVLKACVDFGSRRAFETLEAKILDDESGNDSAVAHGTPEAAGFWTVVGDQVTHDAAGKTVARPGRVQDVRGGERWDDKNAVG